MWPMASCLVFVLHTIYWCLLGVDEVLESSPPPSPVTVGVSPPDSPVSNPSVDSNESVILLGAEGPKFDPLIASR